jgi:hypothetical protein
MNFFLLIPDPAVFSQVHPFFLLPQWLSDGFTDDNRRFFTVEKAWNIFQLSYNFPSDKRR